MKHQQESIVTTAAPLLAEATPLRSIHAHTVTLLGAYTLEAVSHSHELQSIVEQLLGN